MDERKNVKRRQTNAKRIKARKKKRSRVLKIFAVLLLLCLVVVGIGGVLILKRYGPSDEKANLNEYYGLADDNEVAVILNNEVIGSGGRIIDGIPYVEYSILRSHINNRVYWDSNEHLLLYSLPEETLAFDVDSKASEGYVIFTEEGETAYVALPFVKNYTDIEYSAYEEPNRVMIVNEWNEVTQAVISKETSVRHRAGVKSPVLRTVEAGETVVVIEPLDDWMKVRTQDGMIGYLKANILTDTETVVYDRDFQEPVYNSIHLDYTVNLGWDNVTNTTANSFVTDRIASTKGLTTLAPTWYNIGDQDGNLSSISSAEYVETAHAAGLDVWAVLRDFQGGTDTSDEVYNVLSYTSKRERLISQVISDALAAGVDGINLDFELISTTCGRHYVQFVRELAIACGKNNLVFSVDNYVPMPYNSHYDIKEQGIVADYVVMMGYDEHTNASYEVGSVASYEYVAAGVDTMLEKIPAEKVIAGMPFYTRLWHETPKTEEEFANQEGTEHANYPMKFTSQALGMAEAKAAVDASGAAVQWDEAARQNYAQWEGDDGVYKIWLEDSASLEEKLKMFQDKQLGGVAAWRIGYEEPAIWDLILQYVK